MRVDISSLEAVYRALDVQSELLASLAEETKSLRHEVKETRSLGLSHGWFRLIVERDGNNVWHTFNEHDEKINVPQTSLKGYITGIKHLPESENSHERLHMMVTGDREYLISTGFNTYFAKELMAAIATMNSDQLQRPVTIRADIGDPSKTKNKPIFANVISDRRLIKPDGLRNREALKLFKMAQEKLTGKEQTTRPQSTPSSPRPSKAAGPQSTTTKAKPQTKATAAPKATTTRPQRQTKKLSRPATPQVPAAPLQKSRVDWEKFKADNNMTSKELIKIAKDQGAITPEGKFIPAKEPDVYQAAIAYAQKKAQEQAALF